MLSLLLYLDSVAQTVAALATGVAAFAGGRERTDLALRYRWDLSVSPYAKRAHIGLLTIALTATNVSSLGSALVISGCVVPA